MRNYSKYFKFKNEKGITLISLLIIIIVMMLIVGATINIGRDSLDDTILQSFYTELAIVQKRIDDIATTNESYINEYGETIFLKNQGKNLTDAQKNNLQYILSNEGAELGLNVSKFKYFTTEELESLLGLLDMSYDVFVDFESRTVIAEQGVTVNRNGISYFK